MTLGTTLINALYELTAPLLFALEDSIHLNRLLQDLGWSLSLTDEQAEIIAQFLPLQSDLQDLESLAETVSAGSAVSGEVIAQAVTLGQSVFAKVKVLESLSPSALAQLPAPLDDPSTWGGIALDLPEFLLLRWLALQSPIMYASAVLAGIVVEQPRVDSLPPRRTLSWSALTSFLQGPTQHMSDLYHWGGALDYQRLMDATAGLANAAGVPVRLTAVSSENAGLIFPNGVSDDLRQLSIDWHTGFSQENGILHTAWAIVPAPAQSDGDIQGFLFASELTGPLLDAVDLGNGLQLSLRNGANLNGALGFLLLPQGVQLVGPSAKTGVSVALNGTPAVPWALLGEADSTRLELDAFELQLGLLGSASDPEVTFTLSGSSSTPRLVILPSEGDAFLSGILGAVPLAVNIPFSINWSSQHGFLFQGGAGFAVVIPVSLTLGPLHIESVDLAVTADNTGAAVEIAVTASLNLGPFLVVADGLGLSALARTLPSGETSGIFGPLDIEVGFLPPNGFGISVDAGIVNGGGYLFIDRDAGTYAGILELDLLSVSISAIGLIDTQLPGGGWSMFLGLFIDVPAIPLGFGFTLNGVGGVAGVNRTLDVEGLQSAIASGSLDSVLFPKDPILNAPLIIDAVQGIFPSAEGRYVFGPVIKIGWGSPTLIEAKIGVIISLPDPIVIAVLGSVTSVLPTEDTDLIALYLEVAGVIDMGAATLSIDSSLHGSHIAGFPLAGDMALRSAFGNNPTFLMALGGSHPGFDRPSGFPEISRLSLAINAGSLIDIRFDCYFAITSNTFQFGSAFELSAEVEGFGISGGAEFDALIFFSPFSLQTNLGFHISVKAVGVDLMAVWLDVSLSGPNPWYVVGTATFTILGIDNTIKLDQKIGSKQHEEPPEIGECFGSVPVGSNPSRSLEC